MVYIVIGSNLLNGVLIMPKFYMLNIENCVEQLPGPAGKLPEIMVMDGQYFCDLDVVEEALPVDVCHPRITCRSEVPGQ